MLVAEAGGQLVEATRERLTDTAHCPSCGAQVIHKAGHVVVPHFAHRPGADCLAASESAEHLQTKALLVEQLRDQRYLVRPEWPLANVRRRLDLAVWAGENDLPTGVAVEIQASRINPEETKARERDHGRAGFLTMWVFTLSRCPRLIDTNPDLEVRVPDDIAFQHNRTRVPINVVDPTSGSVFRVRMARAWREGRSWGNAGGGGSSAPYLLRKTFTTDPNLARFTIELEPGRYDTPDHPHLVPVFSD